MKNRILPFLFSLFLAASAGAQTTRLGQHDPVAWQAQGNPYASSEAGQQIAQQIMDVVGLKPNFEVVAARVPNAAAVVYGGKRYILYNPTFIDQLARTTGTQWAAVSVLAHEIGHHLNGHTITASGSQPNLELDADEFSGFVLKKMGATLEQAQAAMRTVAQQRASSTHPAQYDRLAAIQRGWEHAGGAPSRPNTDLARQPAPQQPQTGYPGATAAVTPIAGNNIVGDIRFSADPQSRYYVTSRYNVVRVANNSSLQVVGKLATLNNAQYPYTIYDNNTQLLVDRRGNILTREGRRVGQLSSRS